jgi:vitamin B12 transporter
MFNRFSFRFFSFGCLAVSMVAPIAGHAQGTKQPDLFEIVNPAALREIVVTATRVPEDLNEILAPVIVITREELAQNLSADVAELLRMHAGIELGRNGGIGQPTSIFIRGANSSHTLVMIDGVRINPGTFGTASLQNIPPDTIERIEIVKGPRSTLYGTDAIGGVINIITRKPTQSGLDADARVGYGSFDTRQVSGSVDVTGGAGNIGANVSKIESEGFPTRKASSIDSPYDNLTVGAHAGTEFGSMNLAARFYQSEGTSDYLNSPTAPLSQDFLDRVFSAEVSTSIGSWRTRLIASHFDNSIEQNQPLTFIPGEMDYLNTRRTTLDWQNDFDLFARNSITAGIMYSDEDARALSFGTLFDQNTTIENLYVQDRWSFESHALLLAAGYSDYNTFGSHTTWNAEYGYKLTENLRFVAAVGTAFRAPSATDLYGFGGNPNLDPESSRNAELSIRYKLDSHSIVFSAFQNDIDNLIAFDNAAFVVRNIAAARIRGYELSYAYAGNDWRVHAEAIHQDPRDRNTDQLLLRRAQFSLTAGYSQTFGAFDVGLDAVYSGPRMDFGFPTNVELSSYVLANMHARYKITEQLSVLAQIDNLTNTQYELANGYNTADRSGSLAIRWGLR